jgi:hypothetical protein
MLRVARAVGTVIAVISPVLSGVLFYWWQTVGPKTAIDPQCGSPNWVLLTWLPFLALPPIFVGVGLRQSGEKWSTVLSLGCLALVITTAGCAIAFFFWFAKHNCGE